MIGSIMPVFRNSVCPHLKNRYKQQITLLDKCLQVHIKYLNARYSIFITYVDISVTDQWSSKLLTRKKTYYLILILIFTISYIRHILYNILVIQLISVREGWTCHMFQVPKNIIKLKQSIEISMIVLSDLS